MVQVIVTFVLYNGYHRHFTIVEAKFDFDMGGTVKMDVIMQCFSGTPYQSVRLPHIAFRSCSVSTRRQLATVYRARLFISYLQRMSILPAGVRLHPPYSGDPLRAFGHLPGSEPWLCYNCLCLLLPEFELGCPVIPLTPS